MKTKRASVLRVGVPTCLVVLGIAVVVGLTSIRRETAALGPDSASERLSAPCVNTTAKATVPRTERSVAKPDVSVRRAAPVSARVASGRVLKQGDYAALLEATASKAAMEESRTPGPIMASDGTLLPPPPPFAPTTMRLDRQPEDVFVSGQEYVNERGETTKRVWIVERPGASKPGARPQLVRIEEDMFVEGKDAGEERRPLRRAEMIADHVMVRFRAGMTPATIETAVADLGLKVRRILPLSGLALVSFDGTDPEKMDETLAVLSRTVGVVRAEKDLIARLTGQRFPDDPGFGNLWGLHNNGNYSGVASTADADIDAPEAWSLSTDARDVVVAIIDTGVDYNHEDLGDNIWSNPREIPGNGLDDDGNGFVDDVHGYDFAEDDGDPVPGHWHGTHVAGTIGAKGNNGIGVAGVNWNVRMMAVKIFKDDGSGTGASNLIEAFNYLTLMKRSFGINIRVTSNSWGFGPGNYPGDELGLAIEAAGKEGILHIFAASNDAVDNDARGQWPSSYPYDCIIAVAATDANDKLASFSNWGATSVDLGAPGVNTYSTIPGNSYSWASGTSMATPHVSGVAALLFQLVGAKDADYLTVRHLILDSVDPIPALAGKCVTGGRLNVGNAITKTGLVVDRIEVVDAGGATTGNGDGLINPGEKVGLFPVLTSTDPGDRTNVTAQLTVAESYAHVVSGSVGFGNLQRGVATKATSAFLVTIDSGVTTPAVVTFTLTIRDGAGTTWQRTVQQRVVTSTVLTGTVRLDGAPTAGVTVECYPFDAEVVLAQTDSQGHYRFTVGNGLCRILAGQSGWLWSKERMLTLPSANPVTQDFAFVRAAIGGRAFYPKDGTSLAGVEISYDGPMSNGKLLSGKTTSGGDGKYSIMGVYASDKTALFTLNAHLTGYEDPTAIQVTVPPSMPGVDFAIGRRELELSSTRIEATLTRGDVFRCAMQLHNRGSLSLDWETGHGTVKTRIRGVNPNTPIIVEEGLAFDGEHLWTADTALGQYYRSRWCHLLMYDATNPEVGPQRMLDLQWLIDMPPEGKFWKSVGINALTWDGEQLWALLDWLDWKDPNLYVHKGYELVRLDVSTDPVTVTRRKQLGLPPNNMGYHELTYGGGRLFTYGGYGTQGWTIQRIDPVTFAVEKTAEWPAAELDHYFSTPRLAYMHGQLLGVSDQPGATMRMFVRADHDLKYLGNEAFPLPSKGFYFHNLCATVSDGSGNAWSRSSPALPSNTPPSPLPKLNTFQMNALRYLDGLNRLPKQGGSLDIEQCLVLGDFVTFDSKSVAAGVHRSRLYVSSNDSKEPLQPVELQVTVVESGNRIPAPVADVAATRSGESVGIDVLANDKDPDGDALTVTWVSTGAHGTTKLVGNSVVYTPEADYVGADTLAYRVSDGRGGLNDGLVEVSVTSNPVPSPWRAADIGVPGAAGIALQGGAGFSIISGGGGIGGVADAFHYVSQTVNGDSSIECFAGPTAAAGTGAVAGPMMRWSLDAGAPFVMIGRSPDGKVALRWRAAAGASATTGSAYAGPANRGLYLKLTRSGTTVTGSYSDDCATWTVLGQADADLGSATSLGLAAAAPNGTQPIVGRFAAVDVERASVKTPAMDVQPRKIVLTARPGEHLRARVSVMNRGAGTLAWGVWQEILGARAVPGIAGSGDIRQGLLIEPQLSDHWYGGMCFDGVDYWIVNSYEETIYRVSGETGKSNRSIDLNTYFDVPYRCAWDGERVWISGIDSEVTDYIAFDPVTGKVARRIPRVPGHVIASFGDGSLWVVAAGESGGGWIKRVNPYTGAVEATIKMPDSYIFSFVTYWNGALYVCSNGGWYYDKFDAKSGELLGQTFRVQGSDNIGLTRDGTGCLTEYEGTWQLVAKTSYNDPAWVKQSIASGKLGNSDDEYIELDLTALDLGTQRAVLYFRSNDTNAPSVPVYVELTVNNDGNRAPSAQDDVYSTRLEEKLTVAAPGVLSNDSDPDGNAITAVLDHMPMHGTLTFNADGGFVYAPEVGYNGVDSFAYRARDTKGATSAPATVELNVTVTTPRIEVAPQSLAASAAVGHTTARTLTVKNIGTGNLQWAIWNENPGATFGKILRRIPTPAALGVPRGVAFDGTVLWMSAYDNPTLQKVDPSNGNVVGTLNISSASDNLWGLDWDGSFLWVAALSEFFKIDPRNGAVLKRFAAPSGWTLLRGIAWDGNTVWIADPTKGICMLDKETGQILRTLPMPTTIDIYYGANIHYLHGVLVLTSEGGSPGYLLSPADGRVLSTFSPPGTGPMSGIGDDHAGNMWLLDTYEKRASLVTSTVVPWMKAQPQTGMLTDGMSQQVTVTFDSGSLGVGSYGANLHVGSNASNNTDVVVPVTFTVAAGGTNMPPTAVASATPTSGFAPLTVQFNGAGSSDPDGDPLTYSWNFGSSTGTGQTSTYTYTNAGTYVATLTVFDGYGGTDTDTVTVTVSVPGANRPPIAISESYTTPEDTLIGITLKGSDPDNDPLTYIIVSPPSHAAVFGGLGAAVVYTPAANYNGADSFTFKVNDGKVDSAPATVSITVTAVNDPPVCSITSPSNGATFTAPASITIQATASDVDGTIAKVEFFNGATKLGEDTTSPYEYVWTGVAAGSYTLTVKATDNSGAVTTSAGVNVTVTVPDSGSNVTVIATCDNAYELYVNGILKGTGNNWNQSQQYTAIPLQPGRNVIAVKGMDAGGVAAFLAETIVNGVRSGSSTNWKVSLTAPAGWTNAVFDDSTWVSASDYGAYGVAPWNKGVAGMPSDTPARWIWSSDANNHDTVYLRYTIELAGGNRAPVAANVSMTTSEDTAKTVAMSANDPDGDALTYTIVTGPAHGSLGAVSGSNVVYTPAANYNGTDSFTYRASDGKTNSAPATVSITVTAVNDPPVCSITAPANGATYTVPATITIQANAWDIDGAIAKVEFFNGATKLGETTTSPYAYTWSGVAAGSYTLTVKATDNSGAVTTSAGVNVTVLPAGSDPSLVMHLKLDETNGIMAADSSGTGHNGSLSNGASWVSGRLGGGVKFDGVDDSIHADLVSAKASEVSFAFWAKIDATNDPRGGLFFNGSGSNGFGLSAGSQDGGDQTSMQFLAQMKYWHKTGVKWTVGQWQHWAVTIAAQNGNAVWRLYRDGVLAYTSPELAIPVLPTLNTTIGAETASGSSTIPCTLDDVRFYERVLNTAEVAALANPGAPTNNPPVANAQSVTMAEDTTKAIVLTGSDPDGDALTFAVVTQPAHGTLSGTAPHVTYTAANYNGADSFTFRVNDGKTNSAPATVSITVTPVNDAPVAIAQSVTAAEDTPKAIALTGNDPDSDPLTFDIVTGPAHGTLSGTAPNMTYTPAANYNGSDSFTFRVSDGKTNSAAATVSITVTAVNDPPVIVSCTATPSSGTAPLAVAFAASATDVDGDTLTYAWVFGDGASGSGASANRTYVTNGTYIVTLTVSDGKGGTATASKTITVTGGNGDTDTTDDLLGMIAARGENAAVGEGKDKAFDNQTSTKWLDFSPGGSWIQYTYATGVSGKLSSYTITSANDAPERDPMDWQLLGSNDGGTTWTTVDSQTGQTFSARFQKRTFTLAGSPTYQVYRLNITKVQNPSYANSVQLAEIELIGQQVTVVNQPPVALAGVDPINGTTLDEYYFWGTDSYDADGKVNSYQWTVNSEEVSTQTEFLYSFPTTGVYNVTLTVWDNKGASDSDLVQVRVTEPAVTVSVEVPDGMTGEPGLAEGNGTIRVRRTGSTSAALTVNVALSGDASNGVDYAAVAGTVVIPAGAVYRDVTISPLADASDESDEMVILTVLSGTGYTVDSGASAGLVLIKDQTYGTPVVSAEATDAVAKEPTQTTDKGSMKVSRTGSCHAALTVYCTLGGTAVNGVDYSSVTVPVVLAAGQSSKVLL